MIDTFRASSRRIVVRRILLFSAIAVVLLAVLAGRFLQRPRNSEVASLPSHGDYVPPTTDGYVGSDACAECHAEISQEYQSHPMAHSITPVDLKAAELHVSEEQRTIPGADRVHKVSIDDGAFVHHELMYDDAGNEVYDQTVPMDYVVGSGQRAKAYLHRRANLLLMSPINWYSEEERWDLAPGYESDDLRRFDRRATEECLSCHAGRMAPEARLTSRYAGPVFHEMAIGCERCHGPGRDHIAWRNAASPDGDDPIVNPAHLDADLRESVCNQCHLIGAARIPRHGRSDFDFRPGQSFDDIWVVLTAGNSEDEEGITAVGHVPQMRSSRCYEMSEGQLGCISCHDPHSVPRPDERAMFYRDRCLNCHTVEECGAPEPDRGAIDDSCIACHMPTRGTENIDHITQTDHRIRRRPDAADTAPSDEDGLAIFGNADLRLDPWGKRRALALGTWLYQTKQGNALPRGLHQFLTEVSREGPADGAVLTVLAAMAMNSGDLQQAREFYHRALVLPESEETAVKGLLKVTYLSSEWESAVAFADRTLAIDPGDSGAHAMRADALLQLGRTEEAIQSAEQGLEYNPGLVRLREWLAGTLRDAGRDADADAQQEIVQRLLGTEAEVGS